MRKTSFQNNTAGTAQQVGKIQSFSIADHGIIGKINGQIVSQESGPNIETSDDDRFTLGKLPAQTERLRESNVKKMCEEEWQPRLLILTGFPCLA